VWTTATERVVVRVTAGTGELALEARVERGRSTYRFRTADGVTSKDAFRESELLLADALWDVDPGRVLVLEANYGVVGAVLAARATSVLMTESSARNARLCEHNAHANDADAGVVLASGLDELDGVAGDGPPAGEFDTVTYAPRAYTPLDVGLQRLSDAISTLAPGGRVCVAGTRETGIARYEERLGDTAASVECVAERDGCRVLAATFGGESGAVGETFVSSREFEAVVDSVDLSLVSVPGVFSASRLDDGTRLLAETAVVRDGDRVLDLCCGYGALGAYAAGVADCEVTLSDDDRVATACAERTLDASAVDGTVVTADGVQGVAGREFDRVLCNPPTHATDRVLASLFDGVRDVLATAGDCHVVHHRDLDLRPVLSEFDVERVASGVEHVVLRAT